MKEMTDMPYCTRQLEINLTKHRSTIESKLHTSRFFKTRLAHKLNVIKACQDYISSLRKLPELRESGENLPPEYKQFMESGTSNEYKKVKEIFKRDANTCFEQLKEAIKINSSYREGWFSSETTDLVSQVFSISKNQTILAITYVKPMEAGDHLVLEI